MKIIHVSDVHLGSRLTSKFNKNISSDIKTNIKITFNNIIEYARSNDVKVILIAGDLFDNNAPSQADLNYFLAIVKNNPSIDFIYLRGNHDLYKLDYNIDNLKLFSDNEVLSYRYNNILISGIEINDNNVNSYYSMLDLNSDDINIVTLHGTINEDIKLKNLSNRNIDYLALGHIHSYSYNKLDLRCDFAYSGCVEPRGFDEVGPKGFILLDINDDKISHEFININKNTFYIKDINISDDDNLEDIINKILAIDIDDNGIYRINICGSISYNNNLNDNISYIYNRISSKFYYIELTNKTSLKIDYNDYINDISIKGEFVRNVLNNPKYSEEEKHNIILLGLTTLERGTNL